MGVAAGSGGVAVQEYIGAWHRGTPPEGGPEVCYYH